MASRNHSACVGNYSDAIFRGHFRSLLAQFGLTPKSKRGLVVGEPAAESWNHLLNGLWWSGLRLGESLSLSWDVPDTIRIDVTGRYLMLRIGAENEKGNRDRLYPVAPQFADMILEVPATDRTGHFFRSLGKRGRVLKCDAVGKVASKIVKRANIMVDPDGGQPKFASAHDLRRSFGLRWSGLVMPAKLKELMRHESIATTMNYYVGRNAETTAAALYEAIGRRSESQSEGDTLGDTLTISEAGNVKRPT
jgi:integrase